MTGTEQGTISWIDDMAANGTLTSDDLRAGRDALLNSQVPRDPVVESKIGDWTYLLDIGAYPARAGGSLASMVEGVSPAVLVGAGVLLFMFLGRKR